MHFHPVDVAQEFRGWKLLSKVRTQRDNFLGIYRLNNVQHRVQLFTRPGLRRVAFKDHHIELSLQAGEPERQKSED